MNAPVKLVRRLVGVEPIMPVDQIGSIYVPDMAKGRCKSGIVKYVAEDCKYVQVGDYVLFGGYTGTWIALEDETILILHEDYIHCSLSNDNIIIDDVYVKTVEGDFVPVPYETLFKIVRDNIAKKVDSNYIVKDLVDSRNKDELLR